MFVLKRGMFEMVAMEPLLSMILADKLRLTALLVKIDTFFWKTGYIKDSPCDKAIKMKVKENIISFKISDFILEIYGYHSKTAAYLWISKQAEDMYLVYNINSLILIFETSGASCLSCEASCWREARQGLSRWKSTGRREQQYCKLHVCICSCLQIQCLKLNFTWRKTKVS